MFTISMIGNLTRDPQTRTVNTANGARTVCDFDLAINEGYGDNQRTSYVRVSVWNGANANGNGMADNCGKYLAKGRKVFVQGRPSVNMYTSNTDNQTHAQIQVSAQTVEFLSPNNATAQSQPTGQAKSAPRTNYDAAPAPVAETAQADELPF